MAFPNPTRIFPFKTKRTNLYYMTLVPILCTVCYLIGIWQHSGTITVIKDTTQVLSDEPCPQTHINTTTIHLDFSAHHTVEDLTAASVIHVPTCSPEFSEYTPCEDVQRSLKFDRKRLVYRERHCPEPNEMLKCQIPAPYGYKMPFRWPESRGSVWYANVPHKELTIEKKNQNWVHFEGDRFRFPGGGTMFPNGANAYIDDIAKLINLRDGSIRTAIDTGCGLVCWLRLTTYKPALPNYDTISIAATTLNLQVASWGAFLLSRDILTMSFAPRDTHEAQVQFALERGVPALIGILASNRLPYPARAFDMAHCSRCLIPWGQYDGLYLIEVDRVLRPGGYWILSGPPINWESHWKGWNRTREDLGAEQYTIEAVARSLCWKKLKQKGDLAIWQKPTNHIHCQKNRKVFKKPTFCQALNADNAWYTKMEYCLTPLPKVEDIKDIAGGQLAKWPERLNSIPPRIRSKSLTGITAEIFKENTEIWKKRVAYYKDLDYQLAEHGRYRNLLDMNSYLGGFAAALINDPVWVMNVVPVEAQIDTLGVIYERGLIGTYQNWCEAMSTYPRTYDFIHSDSIFSLYKDRCEMNNIVIEMDRILRPKGSVIFRDDVDMLVKIKNLMDTMQYDTRIVDHENGPHERVKVLLATKQYWTAPSSNLYK